MAYLFKNAEGDVIAASVSEKMDDGWLFVEDNAREYLEFLESSIAKNAPFRESDIQLARVLEDLISILIERNLIQFTDFPLAAQQRLNDRQNMRSNTHLSGLID